jgi:hypothetical protein
MWLPILGKTPKGNKPQGRQPNKVGPLERRRQGDQTLKGSERLREVIPKSFLFRDFDRANTSKAGTPKPRP